MWRPFFVLLEKQVRFTHSIWNTPIKAAITYKLVYTPFQILCWHKNACYPTKWKNIRYKYFGMFNTLSFLIHKPSIIDNIPIESA